MDNLEFVAQLKSGFRGLISELIYYGKKILLLDIESDQSQAKSIIEAGISIRGVRLWFLLASCLIASIGLNTNSTAVIIGAMLISPLMGPILGLGFGMAVASRRMIRSSIQNLFFAISISLIVASLYFLISPFQNATPEILARTAPNLLDLLVAIAAAFAGVVAMNSNSLAGAVPGVAIATAIMPPLCASAYGIAHGDWKIAGGAFYLFFVNAFAIAVVAYLLFKRMHYSADAQEVPENRLRPAMISFVVLLIVAPLGWSLWDAWRDNFVQRSISRLVQNYKTKLEVVSWQWEGGGSGRLVLYNFRKTPPETKLALEDALKKIAPKAALELHESSMSPEMELLANGFKTSQFSALLNNPKIVEGLVRLADKDSVRPELMTSVRAIESELALLLGNSAPVSGYIRVSSESSEVLYIVSAKNGAERARLKKEVSKYQSWLSSKLESSIISKIEVL